MSDPLNYDTQVGPNGLGYAYRSDAPGRNVGLCARHRADGTPRLVFDLQINYRRSRRPTAAYVRRLAVEFALVRHDPQVPRSVPRLPKGVGVLIGQRDWEALGRGAAPPSSEPWQDWRNAKHAMTSWNKALVYLVSWSVELSWPTLRIESVHATKTGISAPEIALWMGDESACLLDENVVKSYGTLEFDDMATYFFPDELLPLIFR